MKRPNLHTALVAHPPVFGASVEAFNADKVKGVAGRHARGADRQRRGGGRAEFLGGEEGPRRARGRVEPAAGEALSSEGLRKHLRRARRAARPDGPEGGRPGRDQGRREDGRGRVRGAVPRPRAHGAPQLHRGVPRRRGRDLVRLAVPDRGPGRRGEGAGARAGEGEAQHHARRRRLRPAREPRVRLRDRGVRDRPRREGAGEGGVDARGRHPRRLLPPDVRAPRGGGPRREGRPRRVEPRHRRPVDHRRHRLRALPGEGGHRRDERRGREPTRPTTFPTSR